MKRKWQHGMEYVEVVTAIVIAVICPSLNSVPLRCHSELNDRTLKGIQPVYQHTRGGASGRALQMKMDSMMGRDARTPSTLISDWWLRRIPNPSNK
jgi:hypothetical protein